MVDQARMIENTVSENNIEFKDFLSMLLGEDLTAERCEQCFLRQKGRRRRVEIHRDWLKPTD